ncbi:MAG TPA: carboxypeptidase regulatory-like domain-containing protein, partial [Candidatus Thermoplasmatota archaeon]|nr:carboxypeptidase regulatory-like domain-containing protein [Candidatus Thermoplasmatota archaeon]
MRADARVLAVLLVGALGGPGCVGNDAMSASGGPDGQTGDGLVDAGQLEVIVTDDSLAPLEKAQVGVLESEARAETDAAGRATLGPLQPGSYTVVGQFLGYESSAKKIDLAAGQVLELTLRLTPLPVAAPYHQTLA